MRTKTTVGAALAAAALVTGTIFATSASAGPAGNNAPTTGGGASATATTPARVFAVVKADGTRARGRAVASTSHIDTGVYQVIFRRNITTCAWTGTVGFGQTPFNGSTGPAMNSVDGRSGTNNGVVVATFACTGIPTDLPFSVVVVCS